MDLNLSFLVKSITILIDMIRSFSVIFREIFLSIDINSVAPRGYVCNDSRYRSFSHARCSQFPIGDSLRELSNRQLVGYANPNLRSSVAPFLLRRMRH